MEELFYLEFRTENATKRGHSCNDEEGRRYHYFNDTDRPVAVTVKVHFSHYCRNPKMTHLQL